MRTFVHNPRGLTLLELITAITISTLLLSGAWRLFQTGIRSYQRGLQEVHMSQGARTLLSMVTRDLQRALSTRLPYGISGMSLQSAAKSADVPHADRLEMLVQPLLPGTGGPDTAVAPGPQRIRYVPTSLQQGQAVALQRATTALGRDDSVERFLLVHEHIQEFSVRYFDGTHWRQEWQQAELPRALEVTVSVQGSGKNSRLYHFSTLVTPD